ncbi:hypothetical protein [Haloechinothrix sp. LS1_15]|uniref:hypothetical protein n=1 Tax=Haloechinothrix sp. LS1_15 TaxID=2652248 RepID=UPI0029468698|nr:hypothetical protein [Haloechinothrix sp. LS1_15]MDV6012406.1 hypothetical protein [Haloechinothrix sp. LS1_15]
MGNPARAATAAATVAAVAFLAGCAEHVSGQAEAADDEPAVADDDVVVHQGPVDVLVEMLPGWQLGPDVLEGATTIVNPEACGANFCDNLNVLVDPARGASPDEFHAQSIAELDELADVRSEREVELDGRVGYEVEYAGDRGHEYGDMRFLTRYTVADGEAVIVTYTARPDTFEEWRPDAEAMLESIEIR